MAELCYLKCNVTLSKVARLEHVNGNTYVGREEWRLALKHYERGVKLLEETSLKNEEEENSEEFITKEFILPLLGRVFTFIDEKKALESKRKTWNLMRFSLLDDHL